MEPDDVERPPLFAEPSLEILPDALDALLVRSRTALGDYPPTLIASLRRWAQEKPNDEFLAERVGGTWRYRSYGEVWRRSEQLARRILAAGCTPEQPVMILAPNSIAHAEIALGAMRAGVPACPISVSYGAPSKEYARLGHVASVATPGLLYIPDDEVLVTAARTIQHLVKGVVTERDLDKMPLAAPERLAEAEAGLGPDTVAKLLFTSGSTDKPKAVPNTHRMLCSNQAALAAVWPGLFVEPITLVDWLPWNHTFGGNFTFNMALTNGGTFFIDGGKPTPAHIAMTVENLKSQSPTAYFNVPAGFDALVPYLESDTDLRRSLFRRLKFLFTAAAALPQSIQDRLQDLAFQERGESIPMVAGWGSTETAPCATAVHFANEVAANIGVPLPGTEIRLVPDRDKLELRVRGPNVIPGYWRDSAATRNAFDEQGFYRMGDAGRLIDPKRPECGIMFDGRVSENFKLRSGTWVNVGALRVAVVDALRPLIQDVVVAGHDRNEIGLLLFPNISACRQLILTAAEKPASVLHPVLTESLANLLREFNRAARGATTRIARFLVLDTPPSVEAHEITDKGYINQRAVLTRRSEAVDRLYGSEGTQVPSVQQ